MQISTELMKFVTVNNKQSRKAFLDLPGHINQDDPNWIRPLDKDIEAVFDPRKNKFFRHGQAERWILLDNKNKTIGRVAAFINEKTAHTFKQPTGGMGFFECVNDKNAAFKLMDQCREWLENKGMKAMDGPVNFGEKDRWWGLLVEGRYPPTYCMNYQPAYYQHFFESYGFRIYFRQYTYYREVDAPLPDKYYQKSERILTNSDYTLRTINKKKIKSFAEDFRSIYNEAWQAHDNFKPMEQSQAMSLLNKIKPIMDPDLIWFAYFKDKPVGFLIMLPEINQIVRHLQGKLDLPGKLKFLYHQWKGTCNKIFGVAFGIHPDFQKLGIEGAFMTKARDKVMKTGKYKDIELIWIGDFNPKMIHIAESVGAEKIKTYYTYRKIFDPGIPFERAPVIK